jgi:hypothetical protein
LQPLYLPPPQNAPAKKKVLIFLMPYVHSKNTKSYEKCILPATKEEFMDKSSPDIEVISVDNSSGYGDLAVLLF